jgi:uncharacterized protein
VLEHALALLLSIGILQIGQQQRQIQVTYPRLTAWLHLTGRCPLACAYCYVTPHEESMTPATAEAAVKAIFRSAQAHGYERVKLKYAGGEPALNFPALQAAQLAAEVCSAESGIGLDTVFLTNGVALSERLLDFLQAHAIPVMLSLDGLGAYQDQQRPMRRVGQSSFEQVEQGLRRLLAHDLRPYVSITLTRQNLAGLPELVSYLLEMGLPFGLNFYRPEQLSAEDELVPREQELIEGLRAAYRAIEGKLPEYSLLAGLADRANLETPHETTCGVGQNYLVVGCRGEVVQCQMDLERPVSSIWEADPLEALRQVEQGVHNLPVAEKECRDCLWRSRCTGGCPRLTYQQTGRYDARSPLCAVYKTIFPEIIHLEALRLIRFQDPINLID